jgi:hypothetical protein
MKTHSSFPKFYYIKRIFEVIKKIIKKYITKPSSKNYSKKYINKESINAIKRKDFSFPNTQITKNK